jgi:flagellin
MSTVINTNLASLYAQNNLSTAQTALAQSVQRLSSGLRVNSARDDAAGLAIAQNMQAQINGLSQASRNLSDATNLLQTADSSLSTISDMLLRLKQLSVQGYDSSLSGTQRLNIATESLDIQAEIDQTSTRTKFNGISLMAGEQGVLSQASDVRAGMALSDGVARTFGDGDITMTASALAGDYAGAGTLTTTNADVESTFNPNSLDYQKQAGVTYTMSYSGTGNAITMTAVQDWDFDGNKVQYLGQETVNIADVTIESGLGGDVNQTLDFASFGLKINLTTTIAAGKVTVSGAQIANDMHQQQIEATTTATANNYVNVTNVDASQFIYPDGGTVTLTAATGTLTATYTDDNGNQVAIDTVLDDADFVTPGTYNTYDIGFGLKMTLQNVQGNVTATTVAGWLAATDNGAGYFDITGADAPGQITIGGGVNQTLEFQSGASSDAFITIKTLDTRTTGTSEVMSVLGTQLEAIGSLNANDTTETWQAAFKSLETAIDTALDYVDSKRAILGSQMNRLSYIVSNLGSQSVNTQNARSAIMDTDFASETAKLTKGQIMQQAATAMLAQANQMPNVILSLLK